MFKILSMHGLSQDQWAPLRNLDRIFTSPMFKNGCGRRQRRTSVVSGWGIHTIWDPPRTDVVLPVGSDTFLSQTRMLSFMSML